MRKIFITSFLILLSVVLISGSAYAVTGVCSNCHTMHNSQDGQDQARVYDFEGGTLVTAAAPQKILLKGDCIGCHTYTTGDTIVSNTPIVLNTSVYPESPLAGGNFYSVAVVGDKTKGHNVKDIASSDMAPPGFKNNTSSFIPSAFTGSATKWGPAAWSAGTQVTCAGEYGCHGNRDTGKDNYTGIRGGHHNNAVTCDGSTVGKSYRFLAGIKGVEDSDWEQTSGSGDHNGYQGSTTYGNDYTISYLCGECHGNFHAHTNLGGTGQVGSGSPWLRHPTDIALNASSGSAFTTDYTTYSTETPVASASPSTNDSTVNTLSVVMCLSCHRAHGTNVPDILRFTYNMQAGGGGTTGCLRCHKAQR